METFEKVFNKYYRYVCAIIYDKLPNEQPHDIAQKVFIILNEVGVASFENEIALKKWLSVTTTRAVIDHVRTLMRTHEKEKLYISEQLNNGQVDYTEINEDHETIQQYVVSRIYEEINKLPPKTRQVFCLFYLKDLTIRQIAEQTGISKNTVQAHLNNARVQLRMNLLFNKKPRQE